MLVFPHVQRVNFKVGTGFGEGDVRSESAGDRRVIELDFHVFSPSMEFDLAAFPNFTLTLTLLVTMIKLRKQTP